MSQETCFENKRCWILHVFVLFFLLSWFQLLYYYEFGASIFYILFCDSGSACECACECESDREVFVTVKVNVNVSLTENCLKVNMTMNVHVHVHVSLTEKCL